MTIQPTLPPESLLTEAERQFISYQPYGLWPENQDSNVGVIRSVLTAWVQDCIDRLDIIHENMFIGTAEEYLYLWEQMLDLTPNPPLKTIGERRQVVLNRLRVGAFTRTWRKEIVESFLLEAIGGDSITLTAAGVPLVAAGVPLYSGIQSLEGYYIITEQITDFHYTIEIDNAITPDEPALSRELTRVTPAGITFSIIYAALPLRAVEVTWAELTAP
jgi:hypothetical protein